MPLHIVTVGDDTDPGGKVIGGSPNHAIASWAIARVGELVDCPQRYPGGRPHGVNPILDGHATYSVDGKAVAVDGSATSCDCKLIASVSATVD